MCTLSNINKYYLFTCLIFSVSPRIHFYFLMIKNYKIDIGMRIKDCKSGVVGVL